MPELPDVTIYVEALTRFIGDRTIQGIQVRSPFLVRTFDPDLFTAEGRTVERISRLGKRIIWHLDGDMLLVFHLMITGRFHWKKSGTRPTRKVDLAAFSFEHGTLLVTEAGKKHRASLHVLAGMVGLAEHDRGGLEVLDATAAAFQETLQQENRTLKRALTDPRLFSGIGNAYSDEILHAARLSPLRLTQKLSDEEVRRLHEATRSTLIEWTNRLREQFGERFPEKVTAFRPEMAVHGKFKQPCPVCGTPVQRVVYSDNELNYCPGCQTGGKLLADRSLSRLLKDAWPKEV